MITPTWTFMKNQHVYNSLKPHIYHCTHKHTYIWALGSYLNFKNNTQFWFLEFWWKENSDFRFFENFRIKDPPVLVIWKTFRTKDPLLWFQLFITKILNQRTERGFQFFFQKVSKNRQFSQSNWQRTDKFIEGYLTGSQIFLRTAIVLQEAIVKCRPNFGDPLVHGLYLM
jgi:hypothetical protein